MHSGMIVARADRSHKKAGVFDGYPRGAGKPEFDGVGRQKRELNSANSELKSSIAQRKVRIGPTKFFQPSKRNGRLHTKY
jgi:hypothetical protein